MFRPAVFMSPAISSQLQIMGVTGLAVGVVALANLFNNAVDFFEYIQLGRNFKRDFQTNLLRLDGARLRLSRWGQSVGLSSDTQDQHVLHQALPSTTDSLQAKTILRQTLELFTSAEDVSMKFKSCAGADNTDLLLCDVTAGANHNRSWQFNFYGDGSDIATLSGSDLEIVGLDTLYSHSDSFFNECRAYGRLYKSNQYKEVAVRAYGYTTITAKEIHQLGKEFGVEDWEEDAEVHEYHDVPPERYP